MNSSVVVVGCFGKTFGIQGWIKIISFTTPRENILKFKPWLVQKNSSWEEVYIENSEEHFDNNVVKLPNCNSPEEAKTFTNLKIGIWREQLPKLKPGEYYWADLLGLTVINKNGINFGEVKEILASGANDVLVVVGKRRRLIPYVSHVVFAVDLSKRVIQVDWEEDFL